jgi:uncharacterized protein YlaN (UPF0358 family)
LGKHQKRSAISFEQYEKDEKILKQLTRDLTTEISLVQVDNLVVMSTPLVATVLLMHRRGISLDLLIKRVQWLYDEIKARKGQLSMQ